MEWRAKKMTTSSFSQVSKTSFSQRPCKKDDKFIHTLYPEEGKFLRSFFNYYFFVLIDLKHFSFLASFASYYIQKMGFYTSHTLSTFYRILYQC
ncbi:hypothetical protein HanHA300_Chr00c0063g0700381 [Helianthus annuus]|nr:hypothetical protein HanHA89_Chr08g0296551 [Helianthus annuus]KAJ0638682.1 hypothetical protein HanHA300_Chr00c0063g0700381 [Helianthus annuus]